jgi:hypothetical protein
MKSGALNHFPFVVYQDGKRVLWNPIERKPLANRPEERVRLRYIDYLTLECGWPSTRIAAESAVSIQNRESHLRADLICYDKKMKPSILIECKSESVSITNKTADQTARYNHSIQADLMCITNGIEDYWFKKDQNSFKTLNKPPLIQSQTIDSIRKEPDYWQKRGFLGNKIDDKTLSYLAGLLKLFWSDDLGWQNRFLHIQHEIPEFSFQQYYRLINLDSANRIAMSFIAGSDKNTYFIAILNRDGNNRALLISNLNQTLSSKHDNSQLITSTGKRFFDLRKIIPFRFPHFKAEHLANIPGFLNSFFMKSI